MSSEPPEPTAGPSGAQKHSRITGPGPEDDETPPKIQRKVTTKKYFYVLGDSNTNLDAFGHGDDIR
jgi:hypothetical protein